MEVVAVDIGGTHARFAIARVADGRVDTLTAAVTLHTADHADLHAAWRAFGAQAGRALPRAAAIALAAPVEGDAIKLTNNPWIIRPALLRAELDVDLVTLINDFAAVGHAVAQAPPTDFVPLAGPDAPFAATGVTTVCGPGTGLGVAQVLRTPHGYHVLPSEGGHMDFAPIDAIDDALLRRIRRRHRRVSVERIVAGPGIVAIHETLAAMADRAMPAQDDKAIWALALTGDDPLARAALDRFCLNLGAVAGDLALAHGADGVVIAGGLGLRLREHLARSGFAERFAAKGRFRTRMAAIPVKLIVHPQPGLYGAAAAFAQEHAR